MPRIAQNSEPMRKPPTIPHRLRVLPVIIHNLNSKSIIHHRRSTTMFVHAYNHSHQRSKALPTGLNLDPVCSFHDTDNFASQPLEVFLRAIFTNFTRFISALPSSFPDSKSTAFFCIRKGFSLFELSLIRIGEGEFRYPFTVIPKKGYKSIVRDGVIETPSNPWEGLILPLN